jgi:SAM-dependent methyltransferase
MTKKIRNLKRRLGRALAGSNPHDLAWLMCSGSGLEVGARNNPYPFINSDIKYADIGDDLVIKNIAKGYGIDSNDGTYVDFILKGPKYGFDEIGDNTFDFCFSDNVLEHTPNPIFALSEQYRIVKNGGVIYCVIPNKKYTFDRNRSVTPLNRFIEKYTNDDFEHTIEEAMDEILYREDHPAANWKTEDQLKLAQKMIATKDGGPHYVVFDEKNTLSIIHYFLSIFPGNLEHFSAPIAKNIHFAIRKTA